jgi:hypothetical protein
MEGIGGGQKRRKLNLFKCKRCREAGKKVGLVIYYENENLLTNISVSPQIVSGHRSVIVAFVIPQNRLNVQSHS